MTDVAENRRILGEELSAWVEERLPRFMETFAGEVPTLPIVEDFRLILCVSDGADSNAADYYPTVNSRTSHHRQLGLVSQDLEYLHRSRWDDDD